MLPSLLLVLYFQRRDVYPEPSSVLWTTFGLGVLSVFPILVVALPMDDLTSTIGHPLLYGLATAFLAAAIPEEIFKFLVLRFYAARHMHFDEPMDGVVYGATASLGFATLENILYVSEGGFGVAVMRACLAVPGHAFLGAIMGYYVGRATFTTGDSGPLWRRALLIPIALHGFYNTPLLAAERAGDVDPGCWVALLLPLPVLIVIGEAVWARRLVHRLRDEQLAAASRGDIPAPPVVVPRAEPATTSATDAAPPTGRILGGMMTLGGGLLASIGGLMTFGLAVAFFTETMTGEERFELLLGGAILGGLPLALGLWVFLGGIRRLNRTS